MKLELDEYCPCCGYDTFKGQNRLNYSICPICFWEDDPIAFEDIEFVGGSNRVSLNQAQKNFEEFGACDRDMIKNTREPDENDIRKK